MLARISNGTHVSTIRLAGRSVCAEVADMQQGLAEGTNVGIPLSPYHGAASSPDGYDSNTDNGGSPFFNGTKYNVDDRTIICQKFMLIQTIMLTGSIALGARDGLNGLIAPGAG